MQELDSEVAEYLIKAKVKMNRELGARQNWRVAAGLFAGLRIPRTDDRGGWALITPALMGCYELEVQRLIAHWTGRAYDRVVHIGTAGGYYLAGLGRLFPKAGLIGCVPDQAGWPEIRRYTRENGVDERVTLFKEVGPAHLQEVLSAGGRSLLLLVGEGEEAGLLRSLDAGCLETCDLVVRVPGSEAGAEGDGLAGRLEATHRVILRRDAGRDPGSNRFARELPSLLRWLSIWEGRESACQWVGAEARAGAASA